MHKSTKLSNGHHTDVAALNGGLGSTESQTNVLVPSPALSDFLALGLGLGVEEDVRLLLEGTLRLDGQLGRHGCENSVRHCGNDVELIEGFVATGKGRGWCSAVVDVDVEKDLCGASKCRIFRIVWECAVVPLVPIRASVPRLGLVGLFTLRAAQGGHLAETRHDSPIDVDAFCTHLLHSRRWSHISGAHDFRGFRLNHIFSRFHLSFSPSIWRRENPRGRSARVPVAPSPICLRRALAWARRMLPLMLAGFEMVRAMEGHCPKTRNRAARVLALVAWMRYRTPTATGAR